MKLSPLIFFILSFAQVLYANPHVVPAAELKSLLTFYQKIHTLRTRFHQEKTLTDMGVTLSSDGELSIVRPTRVVWKVDRPSPITVTLEDGKIEIISGTGKTATTENYGGQGGTGGQDANSSLKGLVAWLKMDPELLIREYQISEVGKNEFRFEPKKMESSPFKAMQMRIKPKGYVENLTLEEKSGDRIAIHFEKPKIETLP